MQHIRRHSQAGFTLVEMLVVAPIVILVIGGLIAAIVAMTGDVLANRNANLLAYDIQDALDRIESDVRLSGGFLSTNNFAPQSKQGLNNTTTKFTSPNALILNSYATTANPADSTRNIVHKQGINACDPSSEMLNDPLMFNIVYFVDSGNTLWRRIVMPKDYFDTTSKVCSKPWQLPSCSLIDNSDKYCQSQDSKLVDGVTNFELKYYGLPNYDVDNPANINYASAQVQVSITAKGSAAGREYTQSGTTRAVSVNNNFEP